MLDRSGSVRRSYEDGTVQALTERVLAADVHLDDDGVVPVVLFDTRAHPVAEVSTGAYEGAVDRLEAAAGRMGTTDHADAVTVVIEHHRATGADQPALVVFGTDGSPDSRSAAERALCEAAHLLIFWQLVGFGSDSFAFLRKLDDHLVAELPQWLAQARRQGIVRG